MEKDVKIIIKSIPKNKKEIVAKIVDDPKIEKLILQPIDINIELELPKEKIEELKSNDVIFEEVDSDIDNDKKMNDKSFEEPGNTEDGKAPEDTVGNAQGSDVIEDKKDEKEEKNIEDENQKNRDNNTEEMSPEEVRDFKERIFDIIDRLDIKNSDAKKEIKLAYDKQTYISYIKDPKFLTNALRESNVKIDEDLAELHMNIIGAAEFSMHIAPGKGDLQNIENGIEDIKVTMPKLIQDLDWTVKNAAEDELASRVKKFINLAVDGASGVNSVIIISELPKYIKEIQEDYGNEISPDDEKSAMKQYISQMDLSEMQGVMKGVKDATNDVKLDFGDFDFTKKEDRNIALALIEKISQNSKEFGTNEPIVDKLSVDFEINNWTDAQEMTKACKELGSVGVPVEAEISVNAKSEQEKAELQEATQKIADANDIDVVQKDEVEVEIVEEVLKQNELNEISENADSFEEGLVKGIEAGMNIVKEIGTGTANND